MSESSMRIETKLVHAGEPLPRIAGAVQMPIFQSATYEYAGEGSYHDVRYLRTNNTPSQLALGAKIAALESAPAALVTASRMAAIVAALPGPPRRAGHREGHGGDLDAAPPRAVCGGSSARAELPLWRHL